MTYYIDKLKSFSLGSPDVTEAWKAAIFEMENDGFDVVAFKIPRKQFNELVEEIERLIKIKMK
jgi:hypothetical protein